MNQNRNPATMQHGSKNKLDQSYALIVEAVEGIAGMQGKPCFPDSGHPLDAVTENLFTYGKGNKRRWNWDKSQKNKPKNPGRSEASERDREQDGSWVRDFVPKDETMQPCHSVTEWQGSRVTWSLSEGEITIITYGKAIIFSLGRSKRSFVDSRDGKRKPFSFAKSELRRLLGVSEGDRAAALLQSHSVAGQRG